MQVVQSGTNHQSYMYLKCRLIVPPYFDNYGKAVINREPQVLFVYKKSNRTQQIYRYAILQKLQLNYHELLPEKMINLNYNIMVDSSHLPNPDEPVCVVAIIGKSWLSQQQNKGSLINSVIDADIFQVWKRISDKPSLKI